MSRIMVTLVVLALAAPSMATAGAYLGVGVGGARVESTLGDLGILPGNEADLVGPGGIGANPDFSSSQVGLQVIAGWMFTKNIGVEVGYVDFGESKQIYQLPEACNSLGCQSHAWTATDDMYGYQGFLVGSYPINDSFDIYGKLGGIYWDADRKGYERLQGIYGGDITAIPLLNEPVSNSDDGFDLATGFGVNLKTDSPFSVRADFTYYAIQDTDTVWGLEVVAVYSFE